jgi:Glycosyl hydrolase family 12
VAEGLARLRYANRWMIGALIGALMATGLLVGAGSGQAAPAHTCDQFGSFPLAGATYVTQNNRWGASTEQCITAAGSGVGFTVDTARHTNTTGPASYPSIYRGCVYGYCTPHSGFPKQVSTLQTLRSTWSTSGPTPVGTQQYNTAYDIWFDPSGTHAGRNTGAEMMVWLNRTSWVQPVGTKRYEVVLAGTVWEVWQGTIDLPVISFVRKTPAKSVSNLPLESFVNESRRIGVVKPAWYITSVQAGFEPWTGGAGLVSSSFSVAAT